MGLVLATWVGPSGYQLSDGTVLEYGETLCEIPEGEARASDNWHYEAPKPTKTPSSDGASR